jgi:carbon-monoxide dehydrogenase large subunit
MLRSRLGRFATFDATAPHRGGSVTKPGSILGHAVVRLEDEAILHGGVSYVDDLAVDGALHLAFVRSTVAHGHLVGVDTSGAETMPGVRAVYTAKNLPLPPLRRTPAPVELPEVFGRPVLAQNTVRFVGELVAAVVATSRAEAVDAAEQIVVDYNPLPAVTDPVAALDDEAIKLFPDHGSNIAYAVPAEPLKENALADADVVVAFGLVNQRVAAAPIEANGVLVEPRDDGSLVVTVPTQMPFFVRTALAEVFDLDPGSIRVIAPAVGGGFGAKIVLYPEYVVAVAAARLLGASVKWTETRSENLVSMTHGRAQSQRVEMGLRRDGVISGLRCRAVQDVGAYPGAGTFMPMYTALMAQGPYVIPRIDFGAVCVATNTTPTSAYRGAGRPEATAFLERALDIAAAELGLDPVDIRKKNFIPPDAFPLTTVTGANYDVADFSAALDEACRIAGYNELRREQRVRRDRRDVHELGIGVCCYIEVTAGAGRASEFASVEVHADGTVTGVVGTSAQGQGHWTTYAMIISELLGTPLEQIRIVQSDTAIVARGAGTVASRSIQIGGSAVHRASEAVLEQARRVAADRLEANVDDIVVFRNGTVGVTGVPSTALSWAELAQLMPLTAAVDFDQGDATYPFGTHIAVVDVDTETGRVVLLRHIAVDDCGRIINPLIVAGQIHGGVAQGVAQALYEQVVYDEDGNPLTTTLADYAVPSAAELPSFELGELETPTPRNPLGAKGVGESGTMGSTTAVHNAVIDALAPYGVRHIDMPVTPERVWRAVSAAPPVPPLQGS